MNQQRQRRFRAAKELSQVCPLEQQKPPPSLDPEPPVPFPLPPVSFYTSPCPSCSPTRPPGYRVWRLVPLVAGVWLLTQSRLFVASAIHLVPRGIAGVAESTVRPCRRSWTQRPAETMSLRSRLTQTASLPAPSSWRALPSFCTITSGEGALSRLPFCSRALSMLRVQEQGTLSRGTQRTVVLPGAKHASRAWACLHAFVFEYRV